MGISIEKIKEQLIKERTNFLLYDDRVNPDVGFPLTESVARDEAIKQLKNEGILD